MRDNLLSRYSNTATKLVEPPEDEIDELLTDCGAFAVLRGIRERAIMLELRLRTGNIRAMGYAWLHQIEFDPSTGLVLHFGGTQVTLQGRNLNAEVRPGIRLLDGLCRHRIPWIQEADETTIMESAEQATIIERIRWQ